MRVGIIVATDTSRSDLRCLLRAEYLAASVRAAKHEPHCALVKAPVNPEQFENLLGRYRPHILAYFTTPENQHLIGQLSNLAYQHDPGRPQFLVGPWTTLAPERAVRCGPINGLLRGECDLTLGRMLNAISDRKLLKSVPGIWLRRVNAATHEMPLGPIVEPDQLSVPDFKGFDWPAMAAITQGTMPAEASRGSKYPSLFHESFDLAKRYSNPKAFRRVRPVKDVIRDIQRLRHRIDPLRLEFIDELFPSEQDWLEEFAQMYSTEVMLPFTARLSPDEHQRTALKLLAKAGLQTGIISLESGDESLREQYAPSTVTNSEIIDFCARLVDLDVRLHVEVLMGLPHETTDHRTNTINLLKQLPLSTVTPELFQPTPGTEIYDYCEKEGIVRDNEKGGSRDSILRSGKSLIDLGIQMEEVYRLNLEKQVAKCKSERGYFNFVEKTPMAKHNVRQFNQIQVTHLQGRPAFTMAVPAESGFSCFIEPNSVFKAEVMLPNFSTKVASEHGAVQVEINFRSSEGGVSRLFRTKLFADKPGVSKEIVIPLGFNKLAEGTLIYSAVDAGGGDGLLVAWIDPVLERGTKEQMADPVVKEKTVKAPSLMQSEPSTPKPVPDFGALSLDDFAVGQDMELQEKRDKRSETRLEDVFEADDQEVAPPKETAPQKSDSDAGADAEEPEIKIQRSPRDEPDADEVADGGGAIMELDDFEKAIADGDDDKKLKVSAAPGGKASGKKSKKKQESNEDTAQKILSMLEMISKRDKKIDKMEKQLEEFRQRIKEQKAFIKVQGDELKKYKPKDASDSLL
jgi:hypothetical protein